MVLECYSILWFPLLVYAMHTREWNHLHIHIFQVPEIGFTLVLFCSHTGNINNHFTSMILEPRLVVFTDDGELSQYGCYLFSKCSSSSDFSFVSCRGVY